MLRKTRILIVFLTGSAAVAFGQSGPVVRPIEPGRQVRLTAAGTPVSRYQWYRNGQPVAGATSVSYNATMPGVYTVVAYSGSDACASDHSDPVILEPAPVNGVQGTDMAVLKTADAHQVLAGQNLSYLITVTNNGPAGATDIVVTDILPPELAFDGLLPASAGSASYNPGERKVSWLLPVLQARQSATLKVMTRVAKAGNIENTAVVSASQPDSVAANNRSTHRLNVMPLYIPNAFTANNDGRNDRFRIIGLERYPENELTIFNRWGQVIFQQKPYQQKWDASGLEAGTYVYILRVRDAAGEWQLFKGHVIVLR